MNYLSLKPLLISTSVRLSPGPHASSCMIQLGPCRGILRFGSAQDDACGFSAGGFGKAGHSHCQLRPETTAQQYPLSSLPRGALTRLPRWQSPQSFIQLSNHSDFPHLLGRPIPNVQAEKGNVYREGKAVSRSDIADVRVLRILVTEQIFHLGKLVNARF